MKNRKFKQLVDEVNHFRLLTTSPYIVGFYGVCQHDGPALICMELMDLSLEELYIKANAKQTNFPEEVLGIITHRTLDALSFCKQNNIIHRDVKPRNVLLKYDGKVKLCDFGESRVLNGRYSLLFLTRF